MDGSFDQLANLPPEVREAFQNGVVSFAVNILSNDYAQHRECMQDERLKRLKYEELVGGRDIERGVRKAQLWATYQVAKQAAKLEPRHKDYFDGVAQRLQSEIEEVDQRDYTFANMPRLNKSEIKNLLPSASVDEDELGWRLKLSTLAELKQRFGSDQAFDILQRLLLCGWQEGERSFDWFSTFSTYFAVERKDNPDLKAAFDGHLLTEIANRLELNYEDISANLDRLTADLTQVVQEDGALTRTKLEPIAEGVETLLERSKPQDWSLPDGALNPDATHLPRVESPFVFPLSLGVEVFGKPNEEDKRRIPYEALNYSEDSSVHQGRRREPKPATQVLIEWLRQPGIHVVTGEPGGGKTTLLSHWARILQQDYLENNQRAFPLYIPLREMRDLGRGVLLDKGVQSYFERKGLWGYQLDVSPYRKGERNAVWLLDGWDELEPSQQRDWQDIVRSLEGVVIISCRVAQYKNEFGRDNLIMGLGEKDQAQFLERLTPSLQELDRDAHAEADERWRNELLREINKHVHLRQLATNPLLLSLIAQTNPPGDVRLPRKRADFYQEALNTMLDRRLPDLNGRQKRVLKRALVAIAGRAKLNLSISEDTLWDAFEEVDASDDTEEQLKSSGILKPKGRSFEFLHATSQEWSLARALHLNSSLLNEVGAHWQQPNYEETLALLWSMVTPKDRLAATEFLLNVGCQSQLSEQDEEQGKRKRSGIRTALHLWHRSGIAVEQESLERLWEAVQNSATSTNLRTFAVAGDERTPLELLKRLSGITGSSVRQEVAKNPNASDTVLLELSNDEDAYVRSGVAENASSTESILLKLIDDADIKVPSKIVRNPNATGSMLSELIEKGDFVAQWYIHKHPNATEPVLLKHVESDKWIEGFLAQRPKRYIPAG